MPENNDKPTENPGRQTDETLARIAKLLGQPIKSFAAGSDPSHEVDGAAELLRLWVAIGDPVKRARLLETARSLVDL